MSDNRDFKDEKWNEEMDKSYRMIQVKDLICNLSQSDNAKDLLLMLDKVAGREITEEEMKVAATWISNYTLKCIDATMKAVGVQFLNKN